MAALKIDKIDFVYTGYTFPNYVQIFISHANLVLIYCIRDRSEKIKKDRTRSECIGIQGGYTSETLPACTVALHTQAHIHNLHITLLAHNPLYMDHWLNKIIIDKLKVSLKFGKIDRVYTGYTFLDHVQNFIFHAILDLTYCSTDRSEKIKKDWLRSECTGMWGGCTLEIWLMYTEPLYTRAMYMICIFPR
jgi:hypothetical protein